MRKRRLLDRSGRDLVGLFDDLLQQDARRHQAVSHSLTHMLDGLIEQHRKLPQACDEVLVVFRVGESEKADQLWRFDVNAIELVYRHVPGLETRPLQFHLQVTHHQLLVKRFLFGETRGLDGLETGKKTPGLLEVLVNGLLGKIIELVIVPLVAEYRSENWVAVQRVFPLLLQKIVERLAPRIQVGLGSGYHHRKEHNNGHQVRYSSHGNSGK